jgi:hypothetical protein
MSILFSFGRWGGFYRFNGFTKRLCLGWIAITFIPLDDSFLSDLIKTLEPQDKDKSQPCRPAKT